MRRASLERARTLRVWRSHLSWIHEGNPEGCLCELQPGRFRKTQRVGGCGKTRCFLCHPDKLLGCPTRQRLRSDVSNREWRLELGLAAPRLRNPCG